VNDKARTEEHIYSVLVTYTVTGYKPNQQLGKKCKHIGKHRRIKGTRTWKFHAYWAFLCTHIPVPQEESLQLNLMIKGAKTGVTEVI